MSIALDILSDGQEEEYENLLGSANKPSLRIIPTTAVFYRRY